MAHVVTAVPLELVAESGDELALVPVASEASMPLTVEADDD